MKKSILEIYALAVCFVNIVCLVVALGIAFYNVVQMMDPQFTLSSYDYNRHQNNDAFWRTPDKPYGSETKEIRPRLSEEELTKQRLESYQQTIKAEYRDAAQSFTKALIVIALDIILFLVHWRIAHRAREAINAT